MDFKEVASKIAKAAPLLGTVLGGPLGGAAGGLLSVLASAFGLTAEEVQQDPQKLLKAIQMDPEAAVKLKQLENELQVELRKLAIEQDKMTLADIANARSREVELTKVTGKRDINLYVLAWTVVVGFFALCGGLMYHSIPQGSNQVVFMLFGALSAGFGQVLQYFFGSSKGSADKTSIIAAQKT